MDALDKKALATALKAIKKVCKEPIEYTQTISGEYDTDAGMAEASIETFPIYALVAGCDIGQLGASLGTGSVVEAGDVIVSAPAAQFASRPSIGDQMKLDGRTWSVKGVQGDRAVGTVFLWKLQARAEG